LLPRLFLWATQTAATGIRHWRIEALARGAGGRRTGLSARPRAGPRHVCCSFIFLTARESVIAADGSPPQQGVAI